MFLKLYNSFTVISHTLEKNCIRGKGSFFHIKKLPLGGLVLLEVVISFSLGFRRVATENSILIIFKLIKYYFYVIK